MRICDPLIAFPNYIVSEVRNPNCNYIGTPVTELASAPANDLTSIRISTTNLQQFDCKLFKLNSLAVKRCPRELSKPWISRVSREVFKAKIQENSPREPRRLGEQVTRVFGEVLQSRHPGHPGHLEFNLTAASLEVHIHCMPKFLAF